ncbi:MAG TPA: NADH-quinone oxidoreductase subunit L [Methanomassiliicoccales archaeon]|nr:NADH-quinone oxidoreductase subunit L [Methanomassiliicoccales archaeon]
MTFVEYTWLIPIFPIIGLLLVALLGKKTPEGGGYFAVGGIAASMVLSLLVAYEFLTGSRDLQTASLTWLNLGGSFQLDMGYYVDNLTAVMLIIVSILCTLILIYSIGYMHEEGERKRRYYVEISLFVVGMLGLVISSNYLMMFIFWEIMGLCSYLLIGFWYYKPSAARAAKKAFLVTRIGDIMFMVGIISIFASFGSLNFRDVFAAHPTDTTLLAFGMFMLFGGSIGKSAQFPLHDWLPDAMEGPTTVSALIHAATMVKAGVFLVARSFPLMVQTPDVMLFVAIIGGFTAIFAATMALNNPNIKRVLAYSTISQLGYMFLALGAGGYVLSQGLVAEGSAGFTAGMSHLMNHAFFKALLFLSAGAVIHAVHTEDMRLMGGLSKKMKITSFVMLIGALSIAGIPPLSGFWSKDEVLATVYNAGAVNWAFYLLYVMGVVTAFLTAFYMFRLWFMTFSGHESEAAHHAHEAPKVMSVPLMILAVFAFASGLIVLFGFGGVVFFQEADVRTAADVFTAVFSEWTTYVSIAAALLGITLAYLVYKKKSVSLDWATKGACKKVYDLLLFRYYFPQAYDAFGTQVIYGLARLTDWFDRKIVDGAVNGISFVAVRLGQVLRKIQTGMVQTYAMVIVGALAVILLLMYVFGGW